MRSSNSASPFLTNAREPLSVTFPFALETSANRAETLPDRTICAYLSTSSAVMGVLIHVPLGISAVEFVSRGDSADAAVAYCGPYSAVLFTKCTCSSILVGWATSQ